MKKFCIILLLFLLTLASVNAERTADISLPAVSANGEGVMSDLNVEIVEGKGRVLLNIEPLTGIQTQHSEVTAVNVAEWQTGFNLSNYDVIFTITANATVVEGPSAGAAMTIATISAIEEKPLRDDVSVTGTIQPDGSIGPVGGLIEKSEAAYKDGDKYFLIPAGEELQAYLVEKVEEPMPGWTVHRTEIRYINVTEYASENFNISIVQVATINDVIDIMLEGKNITKSEEERIDNVLELEGISVPEHAQPMQTMVEKEIEGAVQSIIEAKKSLEDSILETMVRDSLMSFITSAENELEKARSADSSGYMYGAANYAFRASIDAKYARDLATYYSLPENEKIGFLGDRITEVKKRITVAKGSMNSLDSVARDKEAYPWGIAAQERLAQAEEKFGERSNNSEGILYTMEIVEGWTQIAENFYYIAEEQDFGKRFSDSGFKVLSEESIMKAESELAHFSGSGANKFNPSWYLVFAKKEYEQGQYAAAYIDAEIAIVRAEAGVSLALMSWDGLVEFAEDEIKGLANPTSVWGILYRDYAKLSLQYAKDKQSTGLLEEAILYARQAEVYEEADSRIQEAPASTYVLDLQQGNAVAAITLLVIILLILSLLYPQKH